MEDFNSKYSGEQVEELLDQMANGNTGGGSGEKGEKGDKGDTGVGVQSVEQTTTSSADGGSNIVTVTLTDGTTSTFTVKNGSKGSQGEQGVQGPKGDKGDTGANGTNGTNGKDGADGEDGATFTPSVDAAGNLSWTNNKGLTNPPTVNIKGPKGDKGDAGEGGGGSSGTEGKEFIGKEPLFEPGGYAAIFTPEEPLERNKVYVISQPIASLTVSHINESGGIGDEYTIMFTASESTIITIPYYQVYWVNGTIPTISDGDMCELSLVRIGNVLKATLGIFKAV